MTEKQKQNIDALIASGKTENFQMAYHLAVGIGDDGYVIDVLTRICIMRIATAKALLKSYADKYMMPYSHAYVIYADLLRKQGNAGMDQAVAEYFEDLVENGDKETYDMNNIQRLAQVAPMAAFFARKSKQ